MTRRTTLRLFALAAMFSLVATAPGALANDAPSSRAYPPSCLPYPLPPDAVAPVFTDFNNVSEIYFYRRPCSGGKGALMLALGGRGTNAHKPLPTISAIQAGGGEVPVRVARSPNTLTEVATTYDDVHGETFVVEYPIGGATLDLNAEVTMKLQFGNDQPLLIAVPRYVPQNGNTNLGISRYVTGSWYDTAHPGEGIFLEVGISSDGSSTFVFFSWFTYDANGAPYWLIGQASIIEGQTSVIVPVRAFRGGRFAGAFDAAQVQSSPWGEVEFSFRDCNAMTLRYNGTATTNGAPSGSGTRQWSRLVSIKGLSCE